MSLEYRSGHWSIIYRPDGRQGRKVRLPLPAEMTKEEALIAHDDHIARRKEDQSHELNPRPLTGFTVEKLCGEYLPWYKMHRAETTYKAVVNVGRFIKEYLGQYNAESISLHHINIYKRMRMEGAKSKGPGLNRTINCECSYISGFIKWAARNGHITPRTIIYDKLPYKRPLPQVLSVEEVMAIIDHAEPFYKAYFSFLYLLGLRSIEVRNLTWKSIDWSNGSIQMVQKGGRVKPLPLPPPLLSSLKLIAEKRPPEQADAPIFLNPHKEQPVKYIRKAIARACKAAGVTKRVTPHLFRHSCATHLMDECVNLSIIQQFLGHSQVSTTEFYSR